MSITIGCRGGFNKGKEWWSVHPGRVADPVQNSRHNTNMKVTEMVPALLGGKKLAIGEFRDWEVKEHPSKNGGQPNVIETTFIIVGRESVRVEKFAPKGARVSQSTHPGFKAGQKVVLELTKWEHSAWGLRAAGNVVGLEQ